MKIIFLAPLFLAAPALAQGISDPAGSSMFLSTASSEYCAIQISENNKMVVAIRMDGSVEFGEGFAADDAAREFWKYLGRAMPNKCEVQK
jgi:hypothetical protein